MRLCEAVRALPDCAGSARTRRERGGRAGGARRPLRCALISVGRTPPPRPAPSPPDLPPPPPPPASPLIIAAIRRARAAPLLPAPCLYCELYVRVRVCV